MLETTINQCEALGIPRFPRNDPLLSRKKAQKHAVWRRKSQIVDKRLGFFHTKIDSVAIHRRDTGDLKGERQGSAVIKALAISALFGLWTILI